MTEKCPQPLVLTDFPGEWAAPDAPRANRRRLIGHLRDVDGLFVVVDPTDLEADGNPDRLTQQEQAIESMFKADGLGLGSRFQRALCLIITKRDVIGRDVLKQLAAKNGRPQDEEFEQLASLAERPTITAEESERLGRGLLDLIFPDKLRDLETRLAAAEAADRTRWWQRWLGRQSRPQVAVYSISQLGSELGRQVIGHRATMRDWERYGQEGEPPHTELELEQVDPKAGTEEIRWPSSPVSHRHYLLRQWLSTMLRGHCLPRRVIWTKPRSVGSKPLCAK